MIKRYTNPPGVLTAILLAAIAIVPPGRAQEAAPRLESAVKYFAIGQIAGKKDKTAKDISGMACLPETGPQRLCLLVNDENTSAQFVRIEGTTITPAMRSL